MALSTVNYVGNGTAGPFAIPYPYLEKEHIEVYVNAVLQTQTTHYTFPTASSIQFTAGNEPAVDLVIEIKRNTPKDPLVDFNDGSVLLEVDLDTVVLQTLYISQEAFDLTGATLALKENGQYGALTRRIEDMGDPVNPQDAVTKTWAETAMSSSLALAVAAKDLAQAAASSADADATATAADRVATAADALSADADRVAAEAAKTAAEAARDLALAYRNTAETHKNDAAASAAAAAASAAAAALFDPSSYFTKAESDARFAPISHTHTKASITNLATSELVQAAGTGLASSGPSAWVVGVSRYDVSTGVANGWPADFVTIATIKNSDFRALQIVSDKSGNVWTRAAVDGSNWTAFAKTLQSSDIATEDLVQTITNNTKDATDTPASYPTGITRTDNNDGTARNWPTGTATTVIVTHKATDSNVSQEIFANSDAGGHWLRRSLTNTTWDGWTRLDAQANAIWETGTYTGAAVPSPANIAAAIAALSGGGGWSDPVWVDTSAGTETAYDFSSLPAGANAIKVIAVGTNFTVAAPLKMQLRTSAGATTSGYSGYSAANAVGQHAWSDSFETWVNISAKRAIFDVTRYDGNNWVANVTWIDTVHYEGLGSVSLSGECTGFRMLGGTFNAGGFGYMYR